VRKASGVEKAREAEKESRVAKEREEEEMGAWGRT
jgi:hypothetical protein